MNTAMGNTHTNQNAGREAKTFAIQLTKEKKSLNGHETSLRRDVVRYMPNHFVHVMATISTM